MQPFACCICKRENNSRQALSSMSFVSCVKTLLIRWFSSSVSLTENVYTWVFVKKKVKWNCLRRTWRPCCRAVSADPTIGEHCVLKDTHVQSQVSRCTIQQENHIRLPSYQLGIKKKHVQEVVWRKVSFSKKNGPISWVLNMPAHTLKCNVCVKSVLLYGNSMS